MSKTLYLCVFDIQGDPEEYHLHRTYEDALDDFKTFVNDILNLNYIGPKYTDDNGRTYDEIVAEGYFRDNIFSAKIEEVELFDD